jgi:predicted amidophosphoribosyltransferase
MDAIITLTDAELVDQVDPGGDVTPSAYVGCMRTPPSLPAPPGLATCRALVAYDDAAREILTALKNRDERSHVAELAGPLATLVPDVDGLVVTWAPTSDRRRRARGFDQAELLARAVARRLRRPARRLLRRVPGPPQAGRSHDERIANPRFVAVGRCVAPVLLIDDVATSGATLSRAAAALRRAGAPVPGQH